MLAHACWATRGESGPVALRDVMIVNGAGAVSAPQVIVVSDGRVQLITPAADAETINGAREILARGLYVAAAVYDPSRGSPLKALRHVWVGHVESGMAANLIVLNVDPSRLRSGQPINPAWVNACIIGGRIYENAR